MRDGIPERLMIAQVERDRAGAFVAEHDGARIAELTYAMEDDRTAVVNHTFVAKALRGRGFGLELVKAAAQWADENGIRLVPVCSYARAVLARDPDLGRAIIAEPAVVTERATVARS